MKRNLVTILTIILIVAVSFLWSQDRIPDVILVMSGILAVLTATVRLESHLWGRKILHDSIKVGCIGDVWTFSMGNHHTYLDKENTENIMNFLNKTVNPTSDCKTIIRGQL